MGDVPLRGFGLSDLPFLSDARSRSICAENPAGKPGGGAREELLPDSASSRLGKGWKCRPCIDLDAGSITTLADIRGPGSITHIWITVTESAYRNCILRIFWDDEETPSVEVPLGDFFANGHALRCKISSLPVAVNPSGGFNCYWPMPFRKRCRITIENQWREKIGGFFYQISYALCEVPEHAARFLCPLAGGCVAGVQRVLPPAEDAAPFGGNCRKCLTRSYFTARMRFIATRVIPLGSPS